MSRLSLGSVRSTQGWANRRRVRPVIESLEDRAVPAVFPVTILSDAGDGSLRDAIDRANVAPGADTIVFDPSLRGNTFALSFFDNLPSTNSIIPQPAGASAFHVFSDITIQGNGETITRRIGAPDFRLFQVTAAGNLTLKNLTLSNGLALGGFGTSGGGGAGLGGAIYNQGTVSIIGCTLSGNQAIGGGNSGGRTGGGGGLGGPGIASAPLNGLSGGKPNGGVVSAAGVNGGFGGGGGIFSGKGGNGGFGGGGGGHAGSFGGGSGGFGGGGGGSGGTPGYGGGSGNDNGSGAGAGMGGALFNQGGTVVIANSTVTDNTARGGSSPIGSGSGYGGGLFNLNGSVTLTNATFAANTVNAGAGLLGQAVGGEVYSLSLGIPAYENGPLATATQNATLTIANSILANSAGGTVFDVVNFQGASKGGIATINATGPNIVSAAVANNGGAQLLGTPFTVADPRLGPLANNGGPTQTMALLAGSPAINAGSNAAANAAGLTTDQRGFAPAGAAGAAVDIGAFESRVGPRAIAAALVNKKVGKSRSLFVRVSFVDTGALKTQVRSPFQKPAYRAIAVAVFDSNGDGLADTVRITARKGKKTLTRFINI